MSDSLEVISERLSNLQKTSDDKLSNIQKTSDRLELGIKEVNDTLAKKYATKEEVGADLKTLRAEYYPYILFIKGLIIVCLLAVLKLILEAGFAAYAINSIKL